MMSGRLYGRQGMRRQKWTRAVAVPVSPVVFLFALCVSSGAQTFVPAPIHGVTVDDKNDIRDAAFLAKLLDSMKHLSVKTDGEDCLLTR